MSINKFLLVLGLTVFASTANAILITIGAEGQFSSAQAGVTEIDFESGAPNYGYAGITGDFKVRSSSQGGVAASPFGINNNYLSVPDSQSSGTASIDVGGAYNYFGLFWGSIDTYNSIEFFDGADSLGVFEGSNLAPLLANGGQAAWSSNRYVNFYFGEQEFTSINLISTNYAFESDNHAFGVPAPAPLALLALALVGLGYTRRKS